MTRGLATAAEVAVFRPAIVAAAAGRAWNRHILEEERDTYSQAVLQAVNLWQADQTVRRFVYSPRFARLAPLR